MFAASEQRKMTGVVAGNPRNNAIGLWVSPRFEHNPGTTCKEITKGFPPFAEMEISAGATAPNAMNLIVAIPLLLAEVPMYSTFER